MTDDAVSRETPPAPTSARGVFASRLGLAERFATSLATVGVERGLIGPREAPRLWERHLMNCAVLAEAIPQGSQVCDVGSGAGLPGVVLAIVRPDLELTLLEPLLRRTTYLDEVAAQLELDNVRVVRARAEDMHGTVDYDVVTSRAVAPLGRLLDWSMPLVRPGGMLLAMKGAGVHDEIAAAASELRAHEAGAVEVLTLGADLVDPPTTALRVGATRPSRLGWQTGSGAAAGADPARPTTSARAKQKRRGRR